LASALRAGAVADHRRLWRDDDQDLAGGGAPLPWHVYEAVLITLATYREIASMYAHAWLAASYGRTRTASTKLLRSKAR